jgi:hypothetical protein
MADRRGSARTRAAAPFLASLFVLALGACAATPTAPPTQPPTVAPPTEQPTLLPSETAAQPTEAVTPAPTSLAAGPGCTAADLKASHDLVEGAAGSRLTAVVLVAARKCSVDLYPVLGLRDAESTELVGSTTSGPGRLDLDPDVSYSAEVRFANWCGPDPNFPLELVIRLGTEEVGVTGSSFPEVGDMPPCNGVGGPRLESGPWTAAP